MIDIESTEITAVIEGMPIAVIVIGADQRIICGNARAVEMFDGDCSVGNHFLSLIRFPKLVEQVEQALSGTVGAPVKWQQLLNGQASHFDVYSQPITDQRVVVSFVDVTQRNQSEQMRSDFVSNISHELRTPLTGLIGMLDTLKNVQADDRETLSNFISIMSDEAARMNRMVEDLLALSRVEQSERNRPSEQVSLSEVIKTVVEILTPLARKHDVTVMFDNRVNGLDQVFGDKDQITQVVMNLLENAINYGGVGPSIQVLLEVSDALAPKVNASLEIAVIDQGPGIAAHQLSRLSERFYRIDSHRARHAGGTGLGLSIVKHIMKRHRGRLKIDSKLGHGSRFSVLFPMV